MRLMNHILRSLIGCCMVFYFDDNLVYSTCLDDHLRHVQQVLQLLKDESLHFVRDFNTIVASLNEIIKCWIYMGRTIGSNLPNFEGKYIQCSHVDTRKFPKCDASNVGVRTMLLHKCNTPSISQMKK
ncbi:hypothetical protein CR513_37882, partial [Mucuna pruriens]